MLFQELSRIYARGPSLSCTPPIHWRALKAGATSLREPMDAFYGDRTADVKDPFGNSWWIATHQEDVSREELDRRAEAEMKK